MKMQVNHDVKDHKFELQRKIPRHGIFSSFNDLTK